MQIPKRIPLKLSEFLTEFQQKGIPEELYEMYKLGEGFDFYREPSEEPLTKDTFCYADDSVTGDENNEDVYPEFVQKNGLEFCLSGEIFIDVLLSVFEQTSTPIIKNLVDAINHYNEYDNYLELNDK